MEKQAVRKQTNRKQTFGKKIAVSLVLICLFLLTPGIVHAEEGASGGMTVSYRSSTNSYIDAEKPGGTGGGKPGKTLKTGDGMELGIDLLLLVSSGCILFLILWFRKEREEEEKKKTVRL